MSEAIERCPRCGKPPALCICAALAPVDPGRETLVLQHPKEAQRLLGTGRIATLQLARARLAVGLSWPSLAAALGRPAEPRRWGVLHLGAARAGDAAEKLPGAARAPAAALALAGRDGSLAEADPAALRQLDGIILLDGTWSEAKALWWRNPWLLRARRLVLVPPSRSAYGELRREPRAEAVSTIEAAALAHAAIAGDSGLVERVLPPLRLLLERYRAAGGARPEKPPVRPRRPGAARHRSRR